MASNWYRAVCDKHKEVCDVIVNDPIRTEHLLGDYADDIKGWLIEHYGCELRLVWRDDQLDELWDDYLFVEKAFVKNKRS